jgi:hypothetical protein
MKVIYSLLLILLLALGSSAATINAASANLNDVKKAYNAARPGDTVAIPAGNVTWSGGLSISKSVTIQGSGSANTIITKSGSFTAFTIGSLNVDVPVRITGLRINAAIGQRGTNTAVGVYGPQKYPGLTKVRIDNCLFYGGQQVIFWEYEAVGCVDHCTFQDCAYANQTYGMFDTDWDRYSAPNLAWNYGSLDAVFYEDCTFIWDANMGYTDTMSDCFEGGRLVFRHNAFDSTAMTSQTNMFIVQHGSEGLWKGSGDYLRGPISLEVYNNTFKINSCYRPIWLRGGRALVANNQFTINSGGIGTMVAMSEEECWISKGPTGTNWFRTVRPTSAWPAEDQVNNCFVFGNTVNGQPQTDSMITGWDPGDAIIQKDRDWWNTAPSASTATTYPNSPSPSSPKYPNPYNPPVTSWTPAVYPHPLVSGANPPSRARLHNRRPARARPTGPVG